MNTSLLLNTSNENNLTFQQKVWTTCGITTLFVGLLWFFKATFNVFLLILAGALIALFFHGVAKLIRQSMKVGVKFSLALSVILTLVLTGVTLWFMGAKIQEQLTAIVKTLPATISIARQQLSTTYLGQKILDNTSSGELSKNAYPFINGFFSSTFGIFTDIYIVLFLGIFFTFSPLVYINGFLQLIPQKARPLTEETIHKMGITLTRWLKGQLIAMLIVAILKGVALSIMGVPMAIGLALIAGILNFIPNFGPLLSMAPAILIALTQGVNKAIAVTIVYLVIQIIEGNIITTGIQQKLINMPAAIIIIAQLFMGIFSGAWGLILATPLVAMVIIIVQETYLKKMNNHIETIQSPD